MTPRYIPAIDEEVRKAACRVISAHGLAEHDAVKWGIDKALCVDTETPDVKAIAEILGERGAILYMANLQLGMFMKVLIDSLDATDSRIALVVSVRRLLAKRVEPLTQLIDAHVEMHDSTISELIKQLSANDPDVF